MSQAQQLNDLAARKQLLLLEADLHRGIIGIEYQSLRGRFVPLMDIGGQFSSRNPWYIGGSALAGLFAMRHWRKVVRWMPQALALWVLKKRFRPN
jgi:hypothetical protein